MHNIERHGKVSGAASVGKKRFVVLSILHII